MCVSQIDLAFDHVPEAGTVSGQEAEASIVKIGMAALANQPVKLITDP